MGHKVGDIDISLVFEVSTQELSKINVGGFVNCDYMDCMTGVYVKCC